MTEKVISHYEEQKCSKDTSNVFLQSNDPNQLISKRVQGKETNKDDDDTMIDGSFHESQMVSREDTDIHDVETDAMPCQDNPLKSANALYDIVIAYAKSDYEFVQKELMPWLRRLLHENGIKGCRIVLYNDFDVFPPQIMETLDMMLKRCMRILLFLTKSFTEQMQMKFLTYETVSHTRLKYSHSFEIFNDLIARKVYAVLPVHTQPEYARDYDTPIGLGGVEGIDFYDPESLLTKETMLSIIKRAMKDRQNRENDEERQGQSTVNSNSSAILAPSEIGQRNEDCCHVGAESPLYNSPGFEVKMISEQNQDKYTAEYILQSRQKSDTPIESQNGTSLSSDSSQTSVQEIGSSSTNTGKHAMEPTAEIQKTAEQISQNKANSEEKFSAEEDGSRSTKTLSGESSTVESSMPETPVAPFVNISPQETGNSSINAGLKTYNDNIVDNRFESLQQTSLDHDNGETNTASDKRISSGKEGIEPTAEKQQTAEQISQHKAQAAEFFSVEEDCSRSTKTLNVESSAVGSSMPETPVAPVVNISPHETGNSSINAGLKTYNDNIVDNRFESLQQTSLDHDNGETNTASDKRISSGKEGIEPTAEKQQTAEQISQNKAQAAEFFSVEEDCSRSTKTLNVESSAVGSSMPETPVAPVVNISLQESGKSSLNAGTESIDPTAEAQKTAKQISNNKANSEENISIEEDGSRSTKTLRGESSAVGSSMPETPVAPLVDISTHETGNSSINADKEPIHSNENPKTLVEKISQTMTLSEENKSALGGCSANVDKTYTCQSSGFQEDALFGDGYVEKHVEDKDTVPLSASKLSIGSEQPITEQDKHTDKTRKRETQQVKEKLPVVNINAQVVEVPICHNRPTCQRIAHCGASSENHFKDAKDQSIHNTDGHVEKHVEDIDLLPSSHSNLSIGSEQPITEQDKHTDKTRKREIQQVKEKQSDVNIYAQVEEAPMCHNMPTCQAISDFGASPGNHFKDSSIQSQSLFDTDGHDEGKIKIPDQLPSADFPMGFESEQLLTEEGSTFEIAFTDKPRDSETLQEEKELSDLTLDAQPKEMTMCHNGPTKRGVTLCDASSENQFQDSTTVSGCHAQENIKHTVQLQSADFPIGISCTDKTSETLQGQEEVSDQTIDARAKEISLFHNGPTRRRVTHCGASPESQFQDSTMQSKSFQDEDWYVSMNVADAPSLHMPSFSSENIIAKEVSKTEDTFTDKSSEDRPQRGKRKMSNVNTAKVLPMCNNEQEYKTSAHCGTYQDQQPSTFPDPEDTKPKTIKSESMILSVDPKNKMALSKRTEMKQDSSDHKLLPIDEYPSKSLVRQLHNDYGLDVRCGQNEDGKVSPDTSDNDKEKQTKEDVCVSWNDASSWVRMERENTTEANKETTGTVVKEVHHYHYDQMPEVVVRKNRKDETQHIKTTEKQIHIKNCGIVQIGGNVGVTGNHDLHNFVPRGENSPDEEDKKTDGFKTKYADGADSNSDHNARSSLKLSADEIESIQQDLETDAKPDNKYVSPRNESSVKANFRLDNGSRKEFCEPTSTDSLLKKDTHTRKGDILEPAAKTSRVKRFARLFCSCSRNRKK